jgi:multidrug efflux pump subunit AcrA (membrane-fusion protein)
MNKVLKTFRSGRWTYACLVFVALAIGCNRQREQLPPEAASEGDAQSIKVTVQPVTFRPVQRYVGLVGTLHGYEEISLGAKVQGRVRKITHDVADRVRPGETLLEIDATDYQLAFRQTQRSLQVELIKLGLSEPPGATVDLTHIPPVIQAQLRLENAKKRLDRSKCSSRARPARKRT